MSISIRLKIKSIYANLTAKEQAIADYILDNPLKIGHSSISDIASKLDIANSTLFQFSKKLGYNGFKDFKMAMLIQENDFSTISIHENIQHGDTELTMTKKVFNSNISTLNNTQKMIQQEDLKKAITIINKAKRLFFYGVGGSGIIATDAYHKFLRTAKSVSHSIDYHLQLMEASLMTPDDCAMLISHTGRSRETIHIAETIKNTGATIIVITSHANSPLAKLGDIVFISISEETEFRSEALASRISQLSIIDSLYVIFMFHNKKSSQESITKFRQVIATTKK